MKIKILNIVIRASILTFLCCVCLGENAKTSSSLEEFEGYVNSKSLFVRARPGRGFTAIASLKRGEHVFISKMKGDWFRIKIPSSASVWILKSNLLDGNRVKVNSRLRAGPGIEYSTIGLWDYDREAIVLDSSRPDWVQIQAPKEFFAWVRADYVKVSEDALAKLRPPKIEKPTVKDLSIYVPNSEKSEVYEGFILPLKDKSSIATHVLIWRLGNASLKMCYLRDDFGRLDNFVNKQVSVFGCSREVEGWRLPALDVRRIEFRFPLQEFGLESLKY